MALNLLAFYLSFPYIYGGGESEKEGGKSPGGSLYSFLVENCWSFVSHYKVKKWWFYDLWIFQIVGSVGISRKKRWWWFLSKISMLQIGGKSYVPSEIRLIVRVDKSTKRCTAIAYCSTMNIRGGAQGKYATEAC